VSLVNGHRDSLQFFSDLLLLYQKLCQVIEKGGEGSTIIKLNKIK